MSTDEHKCIRYLMKEMDPSEELEFEHLMREDENLLIEVESLRATYKRTSQLSIKNPPEFLTRKILNDLKQLPSSSLKNKNKSIMLAAKGLAAAIVIAALSGGYYYVQKPVATQPENSIAKKSVQPWIDRNEVIKLPVQTHPRALVPVNNAQQNWNLEFERSYQKLQLVKFYNNQTGNYNGFHLTGTSE